MPAGLGVRQQSGDGAVKDSVFGHHPLALEIDGIDEPPFDGFSGLHGIVAEDLDLQAGSSGQDRFKGSGRDGVWRRRRVGRRSGLCEGALLQRLRSDGVGRKQRDGAEHSGRKQILQQGHRGSRRLLSGVYPVRRWGRTNASLYSVAGWGRNAATSRVSASSRANSSACCFSVAEGSTASTKKVPFGSSTHCRTWLNLSKPCLWITSINSSLVSDSRLTASWSIFPLRMRTVDRPSIMPVRRGA